MIFGYSRFGSPDACEQALPDAAAARRLLHDKHSDIAPRLAGVVERLRADARGLDAAVLATARLGLRHGSFGNDWHAYHNEAHVLELAERRLGRLAACLDDALTSEDATVLLLFAACHDLRQRETGPAPGPIDGNEAASIAEAFRILDVCGFERERDRAQYVALELMIAGSTFTCNAHLLCHAASSGAAGRIDGAFARGLAHWLDRAQPQWREQPALRRGERLARLAADLDTANVGEEFAQFCETALRLCREREMRAGRRIDSSASAASCLDFLGAGQVEYFFKLHRFCSREGQGVFGPQKSANAVRVRETSGALVARFADRPPATGAAVLEAFAELIAAN